MNKLPEEEGISNNYSNCMLELKAKLGVDEEFKKLSNEEAEIITREIAGILKDLDANPPVQSGSFSIKKSFTLNSKAKNTYPTIHISSPQPDMIGISDYHNLFEMQEQVKNFSSLNDLLYKFGSGGMMGGNDVGGFGNLNPMKFWQNNPMLGKTVNGGTNPTTYTVKNGDTLYTIAKNNNVSLSDLERANTQIQNPDLIYPGQKINIPASNSQSNEKPNPASSGQSGPGTYQAGGGSVQADYLPAESTQQPGPYKDSHGNSEATPNGDMYGPLIDLKFVPNSGLSDNMKWVQTVQTNYDARNIFDVNPPLKPMQFVDPPHYNDLNSPHFYSNNFNNEFFDDPGRPASPRGTVYWRAETSLVKVNSDGTLVRLITFTWGFNIYSNGQLSTVPLKKESQASEYHNQVISSLNKKAN